MHVVPSSFMDACLEHGIIGTGAFFHLFVTEHHGYRNTAAILALMEEGGGSIHQRRTLKGTPLKGWYSLSSRSGTQEWYTVSILDGGNIGTGIAIQFHHVSLWLNVQITVSESGYT
jgi:hypothetical protein